ncbi:hypothetical protein ACFL48_00095 [Pseudomonadota bacterium]
MKSILKLFCLIIVICISSAAYAEQKRVLSSYDLWAGKDKSSYNEEKALINKLVAQINHQKKLFSPSIYHVKGHPEIAVLIAAFGGDGEHSEEYSWVFNLDKDIPELIAGELPYFISNIWWIEPNKSLGFTGEFILNFCFVCDGPDAADLDSLVAIPISGVVSKDSLKVEISSGPYSRSSIYVRLNELEQKNKSDINLIRNRLDHARKLIDQSHSSF